MTIWQINTDKKSLYKKIPEIIEDALKTGDLKPGDKLPTHRDLADTMGINVSTVTKGYKEAEKRGLITGTTGKGTFISFDAGYDISLHNPKTKKLIEFGLIIQDFNLEPSIAESIEKISLKKNIASLLDYGAPGGSFEHRYAGAIWAEKYGIKSNPGDILVCCGAQHALTCSLMGLFKAGERIAVSSLTYPGIKSLAGMLGVKLTGIPMDDNGMTPEGLETACKREVVKGVYLMPGVQNPTTCTMPEKRRDRLTEIIKKYNLLLIEDDAYALTMDKILTPVSEKIPERSVYIAGISKVLGAGLRVGYIISKNPVFRQKLSKAILNSMWMAPPLNAEIASLWIMDGTCDRVMKIKRDEAFKRNIIAGEILKDYTFKGIRSGFFIWLDLPEHWTGLSFEENARDLGINVFCSEKFITGNFKTKESARIALTCGKNTKEFERNLILLKRVLDGEFKEAQVTF